MTNLTSGLIITLKDDFSGPAKTTAKNAKGLEAALKSVKGGDLSGIDQGIKRLKSLDQQIVATVKDAEKLGTSMAAPMRGFSEGFKSSVSALQLSRREINSLARDAVRMQAQLEKSIGSITNPKIRQQLIDKDATQVEAKLLERARKLKTEKDLRNDLTASIVDNSKAQAGAARQGAKEEAAAARLVARERSKAVRDAAAEQRRFHHEGAHAATLAGAAVGVGYGGHAVVHAARSMAERGAEYQREGARGFLSGLTPEEQARSAALAMDLQSQFPSLGRVQLMEHFRSLKGTLGDAHHAEEMLPDIARAQVVLGSLRGQDRAGHDLDQLVKGLEGAGLGAQPEKFRTMLGSFVKASSLFGDTISGEGFREYIQNSKSSKYGLSEAYLAGVAPTMMQHEGAGVFGTMQRQAFSALIGDRQTKKATAAQIQFGMRDKKGKLVDEGGFVSDPYAWAVQHVLPELGKRGIDLQGMGKEKGAALLTRLFSNANAGEFFASLLMNRSVIDKDRENLKSAKDGSAAEALRGKDPFVSAQGLTEAISTFASTLASPAVASAPQYINAITDSLNVLSSTMQKNPAVQEAAGKAAVAAGAPAMWGIGSFLTKISGSADGIVPNILRTGGGWLSTIGRFATTRALPAYAGWQAGSALGSTIDQIMGASLRPDAPTIPSTLIGNPVEQAIDALDARRKAAQNDPENQRRRLLEGVATLRGSQDANDGNFGTSSLIGAGLHRRAQEAIDKLETTRFDLEERARESARGRGYSGFPDPGTPAPGIPTPPPRPGVDTTAMDDAGTKAEQTGEKIKTGLNVVATPTVDTSSLSAASSMADGLISKLERIGSLGKAAIGTMNSTMAGRTSFSGVDYGAAP